VATGDGPDRNRRPLPASRRSTRAQRRGRQLQFEDNVLTISGDRKLEHADQQQGYYRLERGSGSFSRSLTLPTGVDPDGISAHFDRGVLEISIPKPEQEKPRTVRINLGATDDNTIESDDPQINSREPVPALA